MKEKRSNDGELIERRLAAVERYGKIVVFCVLVFVAILLTVGNLHNWTWLVPFELALLLENAIKFWVLRTYKQKVACYVLDTFLLLVLTFFSDGSLTALFYIVILSEYYLQQETLGGSIALFACDTVFYLVVLVLTDVLNGENIFVGTTVANALNDLLLLVLHFLIFNFTLQITRKNREIARTLSELNESNEKLSEAYRDLQEVTALEERQRIAKEIHDTAGHSITTVIMQTEAAKLMIESDPAEAKRRISAANLQAKHALEELRESVHLLSGIGEHNTLKAALGSIIHDSTDGTGIVVRSEIEEVTLCDAKSRFICNTLKEGISNGLRHGNATAFWFELKKVDGRVEFLLSDNGRGMELAALKEGFGLTGMRRHAESLGGKVWFDTEFDEGFEIHLTLPLDGEEGGNKREN